MTKVHIVCPNGRTLPLFGGDGAPKVRFTRWRDLLALAFWPTYVFGVGFAKQRILMDEVDLDVLFAGGGNSNAVLGWIMRFFARFGQLPALRRHTQQRDIEAHYSRSNEYYLMQLAGEAGPAADGVGEPGDMAYSCARFLYPGGTLKRAQLRKLLDIFFKLGLFNHAPGVRGEEWLLDIGCGWGDLAVLAACLFRVNVLGITLSEAQADRARRLAQVFGVADLVTIEVMNYLDLPRLAGRRFDYITSVGMFEHVDRRHQRRFFGVVRDVLKPDGAAVLHCIVRQVPGPLDLWVRKKIFPHGHLAAGYQIDRLLARHGFFTAQVDYLWEEYAITLEHWLAVHVANRERVIADLGIEFYLERLLWLKGSISAFRHGGRPGARHQGLKVGQWLFMPAKPPAGMWPLGHRTDTRLLEQFVATLEHSPGRLM